MDWIVCYAMYINSGNSFIRRIHISFVQFVAVIRKRLLSLNSSYRLLIANAWAPS